MFLLKYQLLANSYVNQGSQKRQFCPAYPFLGTVLGRKLCQKDNNNKLLATKGLLPHAIAHGGCTNTVRESALKVDWEIKKINKKNLPHLGVELSASEVLRTRDLLPSCCFSSTKTIRLIRDGSQRTATSIFTQFLSSGTRQSISCAVCLPLYFIRSQQRKVIPCCTPFTQFV